MSEHTNDSEMSEGTGQASGDTRLPYEAPRVLSGPVFEKVILTSGCNTTQEFFCPLPCD